jgi:alpha-glucosidase
MKLKIPTKFQYRQKDSHQVIFENDRQGKICIKVYDQDVIRVTHWSNYSLSQDRILPDGLNPQLQENMASPSPEITVSEATLQIKTDRMVVTASFGNFFTLEWKRKDEQSCFLKDHPVRGYEYDLEQGVTHKTVNHSSLVYYGLGEKASPLYLNERRFRLACSDPMGYNAERTDPLYKHIPFFMVMDKSSKKAYGMFYNTYCLGSFDFGCEIDALHGSFSTFTSESDVLDYFVLMGPTPKAVVQGFAKVVGYPALVPKYALGYLASAMGYAEIDGAQSKIENFPNECKKHGIPCDALHLSSGYTVDPVTGDRNVFTWNHERFPEPESMLKLLNQSGIKVMANVKPWLLKQHPDYPEIEKKRGFLSEDNVFSSELELQNTCREYFMEFWSRKVEIWLVF